MVKVGGLPVQLSVGYEHNFADDFVGPEDTLTATVKVLVPLGG